MKYSMHLIKHIKPLIFSWISLFILWVLFRFFNEELSFKDESNSYFKVAIIYNFSVFIFMLMENNLEHRKAGYFLIFLKKKILNLKFLLINVLTFILIVNYALIGINVYLAFILFFFNNSVTFLVFNLLKNYSINEYKNDNIILFCMCHLVFLHLIIFFGSSSIVGEIMHYIPIISIYFLPLESYKILLISSAYFGYLIILTLGYRILLKRYANHFSKNLNSVDLNKTKSSL